MVLEAYGLSKTEGELRDLTNCSEVLLGTEAWDIVLAARSLGFSETRKHNLNLEELSEQVVSGIYPIVFMRLRLSQDLQPQEHYAVVTAVSERQIELLDPWRGECSISTEQFLQDWSRGLTILVQA
jgi:ABC-type bacteriocin/lantibiotic exporter with double-glycine peptidase domain